MTPKYKVGNTLIYIDNNGKHVSRFVITKVKRSSYEYEVHNPGQPMFLNSVSMDRLHYSDIILETKLHKVLE